MEDVKAALLDAIYTKDKQKLIEHLEKNKPSIPHLHRRNIMDICTVFKFYDALYILIDYGFDVNSLNVLGLTVLTTVAAANDLEIVDILLKKGADPNIGKKLLPDRTATPLCQGVTNRNAKIVELLLKRGAKILVGNISYYKKEASGEILDLLNSRKEGVLPLRELTINAIYRLKVPHDHIPEILFD